MYSTAVFPHLFHLRFISRMNGSVLEPQYYYYKMNEPNIPNQPKWSKLVLDFHMPKRFHMCHSVIFLYFIFFIFSLSFVTFHFIMPKFQGEITIIWSRRLHWILNKLLLFIKMFLTFHSFIPFHFVSFRFVLIVFRLCYYYDYYYSCSKTEASFVTISKSTK